MNNKEVLLLTFTIFLTIVAWVVFELFTINKETPTESQIDSTKLNYNIDVKLLDTLNSKTE